MSEPDRRSGNAEPAPQLRVVQAQPSASPHWHGLLNAENEIAFCSAWLALQCSSIPGVTAGLLVMRQHDPSAQPVSVTWPARDLDLRDLSRLADRAYAERRAIVTPGRIGPDASPQPVGLLIALPLGTAREPVAIATVALSTSAGVPAVSPESVAEQ